ncbi:MAG: hypothetical protein ABMA64_21775 [Myxococcota bacterium]
MTNGRYNVGVGLLAMAFFMAYGFFLIYLRDFAPGKEEWIAQYGLGKHFETRLAHVHGNLFGFLNVMLGFVIPRLTAGENARRAAATLALVGLLMPTGILMEVYFGAPPIFVLIGAASMTAAVAWTGGLALRGWTGAEGRS